MEVDLLVLHRSPEPLGEDVVEGSTFAIHTDLDVKVGQHVQVVKAGELGSLVRIVDFRSSGLKRLREGFDAAGILKGIRETKRDHIAAEPIDDGHQVEEAVQETDVGDIRAPDMIRSAYENISEQIRILPMLKVGLARVGAREQGFDAHPTHQAAHSISANIAALLVELHPDPTGAVEGPESVDLIDHLHE